MDEILKVKTCCVTGHRDIPDEKIPYVREQLLREIEQAIKDGYRVFVSGFAEGADTIFSELVLEKKKENPEILLEAALPYYDKKRNGAQIDMLRQCCGIYTASYGYKPNSFMTRNRYMVQISSRVLAVYDGREKGGTLFTMRYAHALEKEIHVVQI